MTHAHAFVIFVGYFTVMRVPLLNGVTKKWHLLYQIVFLISIKTKYIETS